MLPWTNWLRRRPLKAKSTGSNPVGSTILKIRIVVMAFEIVLKTPWLFRVMKPFFSAIALAAWPFILVNNQDVIDSERTMNHERIHHRQELEMMVVPMIILYVAFNIFWFIRTRSVNESYLHNPFEQEAMYNEDNLDYLDTRKFLSWTKYVRRNPRVAEWKAQNPGKKV